MENSRSILSKKEDIDLQQKLRKEYLSAEWTTYAQAARRHGVSDTRIGKLMRRVKAGMEEDLKEGRENEVVRILSQIELTIGKAYKAFEMSQESRSRCKSCKGLGENQDGDECEPCGGEGWIVIERPGDPRFLTVVLKALDKKAKIYQMYPESNVTTIGRQLNLVQGDQVGGRTNLLEGASTELLLRANRLILELKNGNGNGEVIDVEVGKKDEGVG